MIFIRQLAGCCAYAHQQWCAVRFSTSLRVILAKLSFSLIFVQNLSPLHEAAEGADFPKKLDPAPVGVAGGVAKIKVVYNLVLLTGIPVVCMTFACHAP